MESFLRAAFTDTNTVFSVFLLIGFVELLVLFFLQRYRRRLLEGGQETTGTVVDIESRKGPKGNTSYYPVFRFRTYMNEEITRRSQISSTSRPYQTGDTVTIIYDPQRPQRFILKNDKRIRAVYYLIGVLALAFIAAGLYGLMPLLRQYI